MKRIDNFMEKIDNAMEKIDNFMKKIGNFNNSRKKQNLQKNSKFMKKEIESNYERNNQLDTMFVVVFLAH